MAVKHHLAHEVKKGDPRIDGPYLDDIRKQQEELGREARAKARAKKSVAPVANKKDTKVPAPDTIVKKAAAPKKVQATKVPASVAKKATAKKTAAKKAASGKKTKDAK